MEIQSPTGGMYVVGDQVANTDAYRTYLCKRTGEDRECLLQIAAEVAHNGALDRAAYFLRTLAQRADELEAEYAKVKSDPNVMLNYGLGFPELVDSFISGPEQGGRRINILAFRHVEKVSSMVPISNIIDRDQLRADLKSSVWVLGKGLKLLAFIHGSNVSVGNLDASNILIDPDQHYVLFFDLADAQSHPDGTDAGTCREEISQVAQGVIALVGGDLDTQSFPDDVGEELKPYTDRLLDLASGSERDASRGHKRFYELVDKIWERGFHPFTTFNR